MSVNPAFVAARHRERANDRPVLSFPLANMRLHDRRAARPLPPGGDLRRDARGEPVRARAPIEFHDLEDASLAALAAHPDKLLEERWRRQTSYFERLERDHPEELRAGLERLRAAVERGEAPRSPGTASVLARTKP